MRQTRKITPLRRCAQLLTLLAIFVIPVMNLFEITFIKGTFYSMDIGDVALADPLAIFQAVFTSRTISLIMVASLVIPVFLVLLFGRVWCSWFCPYYLLTEGVEWVRSKLAAFGVKPFISGYCEGSTSRQNCIRYLILGGGLLLAGIAGIPLLNLVSAPGIISSQALVLVKFQTVTFELAIVLFILVLEFFFFKYWCRLFCPTGSFLSLMQVRRGLKVKKIELECSSCHTCIHSCPMQINPMTEGHNPMCHNCGICIDACPDNQQRPTLGFRFN